MEMARGLLAVWMEIPEAMEDEFNDWYNTEHVPERAGLPGFLAARRYVSVQGGPKYSALYPLRDLNVLSSDDYLKLRKAGATPWTRRIGRNLKVNIRNEYELIEQCGQSEDAAPFVQELRFEAPAGTEDEVLAWLTNDHLPALAGLDGVVEAKLYRATVGGPKYLAVCELAGPDVTHGEAWKRATESGLAGDMLGRLQADVILGRLILAAP